MQTKLIKHIEEIKNHCIYSVDSNKEKVIKTLDLIIESLKNDNQEAIDNLIYLLGFKGEITELAKNNNWTDELKMINEDIYIIIREIRLYQKYNILLKSNYKNVHKESYATSPGKLHIDEEKWNDIKKFFNLSLSNKIRLNRNKNQIAGHIQFGDTNPAIVVSINPLLIAPYSEDMDAVVILKFPDKYTEKYNLQIKDKLITVNQYWTFGDIRNDIFVGENYQGDFKDFFPIIGDFISSEINIINTHKEYMSKNLWLYVENLSFNYIKEHKNLLRKPFSFLR